MYLFIIIGEYKIRYIGDLTTNYRKEIKQKVSFIIVLCEKVIKYVSKNFHLILVDCYGHGKSSHNREKYNLVAQSNDLIEIYKNYY